MSRGVGYGFRIADKYLAEEEKRAIASLTSPPTDEDRKSFFEAARLFLSSDPEIRKLPAGRRRATLRAPTFQLLLDAADQVFDEDHARSGSARLRMAQLIVAGIHATKRRVLRETTLRLREASEQAQAVRSKSGGKSGRSEANVRHKRRVAFLKPAAEKLLETTALRTEKGRARRLLNQAAKHPGIGDIWPTVEALIEFARRNRIRI
jgi:hypothetical protein